MDHEDIVTALTHALGWKTSSWTSKGQNCVEVTTAVLGWAGVRDTKKRAAGLLAFNAQQWIMFIQSAANGQLDRQN